MIHKVESVSKEARDYFKQSIRDISPLFDVKVKNTTRGRNKTRIFNTLINRGWKQEPNPEYLSNGEFYAHNHSRIGIIVE